ncbi:hypothetical protein M7I_6523 [Glarea lozoyensis 74030]|uniref:Uncharacterized protein n=1 Tax=Glarea lozoyensis (strain ATCC 74030 / MF5533) TaxID=1104152 RepID=H0EUT4_GLAL7|nr:hypothetical protein M7I_6523 [Glarea lozoyensis 74030]
MLRGLQSFGTAALTATCQAVIGDISTPQERKKYIGFFGAISQEMALIAWGTYTSL